MKRSSSSQRAGAQQKKKRPLPPKGPRDVGHTYRGYHIPSAEWEIARVDAKTVSREEFFEKYISQRQPCILTNLLEAPDFAKFGEWTDEYLREKAGESVVKVEQRRSTTAFFGESAPRIPMRFSDLLTHIANKCPYYYLTSQTEDYAGSDLPALLAPPLTRLASDFPLRPELFSPLVPYQMNLWFGQAKVGSSSGLHHDFHDNLYLLLRGAKRFHLFSPKDAGKMYTRGKVVRVHPSGVLVYSSNRGITRDGVPAPFLARFLRREIAAAEADAAAAEAERVKAEAAGDEEGAKKAEEAKKEANERADTAIDMNMDLEMDYGGFMDLESDGAGDDDGLDSGAVAAAAATDVEPDSDGAGKGKDDDAETDKAHVFPHFSAVPRALLLAHAPATSANIMAREVRARAKAALLSRAAAAADDADGNQAAKSEAEMAEDEDDVIGMDDVFRHKPEWESKYEAFLRANKGVVYLVPGEALYLPAGWFHEVTSAALPADLAASAASGAEAKAEEARKDLPLGAPGPGHMALNYWFHPPSADAPTPQQPYRCRFWEAYWAKHYRSKEESREWE